MKTLSLLATISAGVMALTLASGALAAPPAKAAAAKVPRTADGRPDFEGIWTNASLTTLERPPQYGERGVLTPAEVALLEKDRAASIENGNRNTDPKATTQDISSSCDLKGFSTGADCAYNQGWTDPGDTVMTVAGQKRSSFITTTPNGRMPAMVPGGADKVAAAGRRGLKPGMNAFDNPETRSLAERCLTSFGTSAGPVMLPLLYNNNYAFAQTKDEVAIWVEMVHDVRHIRIGGKHLPADVKLWMGDSIGWWEGDTLVAETTNYNPSQYFRGASANLKVTERFTRVSKDRILYQFKVEDPTVWTQAWGGEYEFGASKGQIYEYACHEGNYALEGILAGARADEADAKAKTALAEPAKLK
ncbi:hypothetical protein BH11PSE2_BH11PSE2_10840 [soil metagenome]